MCEREDQYCDYGYYDNKDFFYINREQEKLKWKDFTKKLHKIKTL